MNQVTGTVKSVHRHPASADHDVIVITYITGGKLATDTKSVRNGAYSVGERVTLEIVREDNHYSVKIVDTASSTTVQDLPSGTETEEK